MKRFLIALMLLLGLINGPCFSGVIDNYHFQGIQLFDSKIEMEYFQDSAAVKKSELYVLNNYLRLFKYHKPDNHKTNVANNSSTIIWLHFKIDTILDTDYIIKCLPHYKKVTFYYYNRDSVLCSEKAGLNIPFKKWKYRGNMLSFTLPAKSHNHYFLKFELYDSYPIAAFRIVSMSNLVNFNFTNFIVYAILLSFILLIFLISLVFYFFNREKQSLYYGLYVFFFGVFMVSSMHVWPILTSYAFDQHNNLAYFVPFSLSTICFALYIINSLERNYHIRGVKVLYFIIAIKVCTAILYILGLDGGGLAKVIYTKLDPFIYLGLFFWVFISTSKKRDLYAYWLIIGVLLLATAQFLHIFYESSDWIYYFMFLDVFWFGIGLAINYRTVRKEKIEALEEVILLKSEYNKELEKKVEERTFQLKQNLEEIDELNNILKTNNINLTKNLVKLEQSRVLNKELTFEEFQSQFPDTEYCYKFLADLKWGKGFVCSECGNTEFFLLKKTDPYLRKCTRCPKIHSPTSNTLFHNLKFPLEKAFYILFLSTSSKRYGLEQISGMISLRLGTVGNFKKKVEERMELKKFAKHPEMNWQDLIL